MAMPFFQTPCRLGYWPVRMLPRAGAQTGWLQIAELKMVPRPAISSRFGVRFIGFRPAAPMQSQRNWSEKTMMIFGFSGLVVAEGACGAATAACAAMAATGAFFSNSRRVGRGLSDWLIVTVIQG